MRAWRRSNAASRSVEGRSVDHCLPTRCTSPAASSACSLESAFAWLRPAALAMRPVECAPAGRVRKASLSRSSPCGDDGRCGRRGRVGVAGFAGATAGFAGATGGVLGAGGSDTICVNRGRHAGHVTSGSRPSGRSTSSRRHLRPVLQPEQRRPACSMSVRSSAVMEYTTHDSARGSLAGRAILFERRATARQIGSASVRSGCPQHLPRFAARNLREESPHGNRNR